MLAGSAVECPKLKVVPGFRMRRASRQAHGVLGFRVDEGVLGAKASWHGMFLLPGSQPAILDSVTIMDNQSANRAKPP
jgi:hypothetical protein